MKLWDFQRLENLVDRGCQQLNDYLITHPQKLEELKICQTPSRRKVAANAWIKAGEQQARNREIKKAISTFHKALEWNHDIELNPETRANTLAETQKLLESGTELAKQGKVEEAIVQFKKAIKLDSTLKNIDPEAKVKYLATYIILNEGRELVEKGQIKEAIAAYKNAQRIDPNLIISAESWDNLCRYGGLHQLAVEVMFACEKAVKLAPNHGGIHDNRGLARALTGDTQGAIEDFQAFINWTNNEEAKAQRQAWIKALRAGENPFTDDVLEDLQ